MTRIWDTESQPFFSAVTQLIYDVITDNNSREYYWGQWLVGIHVQVTTSDWSDFTAIDYGATGTVDISAAGWQMLVYS